MAFNLCCSVRQTGTVVLLACRPLIKKPTFASRNLTLKTQNFGIGVGRVINCYLLAARPQPDCLRLCSWVLAMQKCFALRATDCQPMIIHFTPLRLQKVTGTAPSTFRSESCAKTNIRELGRLLSSMDRLRAVLWDLLNNGPKA